MQLYLIRHAESENNARPEHDRVEDPSITTLGRRQAELMQSLSRTTQLAPAQVDAIVGAAPSVNRQRLGPALAHSLRFRLNARKERRRLWVSLQAFGVPEQERHAVVDLASRRSRLEEQLLLLPSFQRLFRYWHKLHLPLAVVMFAVLAVHVAIAVALGYTWSL